MERGVRFFVNIPDLGWLFVLATLGAVVPFALNIFARVEKSEQAYGWADKGMFISILLQVATLGAFILRARQGIYLTEDGTALPDGSCCQPIHSRRRNLQHLRIAALSHALVATQ